VRPEKLEGGRLIQATFSCDRRAGGQLSLQFWWARGGVWGRGGGGGGGGVGGGGGGGGGGDELRKGGVLALLVSWQRKGILFNGS